MCRKTYLFLHNIGASRFKAIRANYMERGIAFRTHGNFNKLPPNACSTSDIQNVTTYISNYASVHGILLPGRIPGYKRCDLQLLPSHLTRKAVWRDYLQANAISTGRLYSYQTFCRYWRKYVPKVIITTPKTDLCWRCQQNSNAITRMTNSADSEKEVVRHSLFSRLVIPC